MYKTKQIVTLSILILVSVSFSSIFVKGQSETQVDIGSNSMKTAPTFVTGDILANITDDSAFGLNATAKVNRSVFFGYYGIVSINDSIEFNLYENDSVIYFNYTIANINANNLTYCSFKIANYSIDMLQYRNATRNYVYEKGLNYTTFRVPFLSNYSSISGNSTFFINAYLEFAYPFEYTIESGEQVLHYKELLYPLINNVPIINGSTTVKKQSGEAQEGIGEKFLDDDNHVVTPQEYMVSNASSGILKWENFTRDAFNYSQSIDDDLVMNIWTISISGTPSEAQQVSSATVLFKSVESKRKFDINPYGTVKITETHYVQYLGPDHPEGQPITLFKSYKLNSFQLTLEPNATVKSLTDQLGHLNVKYQLDNGIYSPGTYTLADSSLYPGYKVLTVHPRYPLKHGEIIDCTIVYTVPLEQFMLKEKDTNRYSIRLSPLSIYNWTVDKMTLDIVLPRGAVYKQSNYSAGDPYQDLQISYSKQFKLWKLGFERILTYSGTNLSPADNRIFYVDITYARANLFISYILLVVLLSAVVGLISLFNWLSKKVKKIEDLEAEKEFVPVDEIRLFVKLYEEVLGIKDRIRQTKEKVAKKKMTVKEGKQLITDLSIRLRQTEEKLKDAKTNLAKHGGKYKNAVQEIEINERKLLEERRNQQTLQQEYKRKKTLTKEAYRRLFRERQKNIEKLTNEINGRLVNLRLLIED
ncbi:MAG: hypothetical protein K9W46_10340 [Candidatus Heimdallarchaeum endolithica]|uniref:Ribophorin I n=1 Tax=Candidatus Heimdallarchaeum endolithica TaxID=2876572 RepID=A0A9Y1BR03_9ARCH|nr:MAG: hypothetical protein K9W46_10340 [Candidatus Heimdallarchaeum endolithica]